MSARSRWYASGWPWELEFLTIVFFLIALVTPLYFEYQIPDQTDRESMSLVERTRQEQGAELQESLIQQKHLFYAMVLIGVYIFHVVIAASSIGFISTPFSYLLSPTVFAMIAYFRLLTMIREADHTIQLVTGAPSEIAMWFFGSLVITFLMARFRMARRQLAFRDVEWDIVSKSRFDKSYFAELALEFRPLVYPTRAYKACDEGIMIVGWLYIMPIPFRAIESIVRSTKHHFISSSYSLATSTSNLVKIQLSDTSLPLFISPENPDEFVNYCSTHLRALHGTEGTHSGSTQHG